MALKDRIYGYTLSDIERELIFQRENVGFVRPIHSSGQIFYLDPSPFLKTPKREVYVSPSPPPEGKLIEVKVESETVERYRDSAGPYNLLIKQIGDWKEIQPNEIVRRRQHIISKDDLQSYFSSPYLGEEEQVDQVSVCSLLFSLSSPPYGMEPGGIHAAVLGKHKQWTGFRRCTSPIPREFRRPSSKYFYNISDSGKDLHNGKNQEISLAYLNPERNTSMHIPLVLENLDLQQPKNFSPEIESLSPYITGLILDAVMVEPQIPPDLDKKIIDAVYRVSEDFKGAGWVPYQQDFGDLMPRLTLAMGRYNAIFDSTSQTGGPKVSSKEVEEALALWEDMFYRAKKVVSTPSDVSFLYELDDRTRKFYLALLDAYPADTLIPLKELDEFKKMFPYDDLFEDAKKTLNRYGFIIVLNSGYVKLLEVRDHYHNRK